MICGEEHCVPEAGMQWHIAIWHPVFSTKILQCVTVGGLQADDTMSQCVSRLQSPNSLFKALISP